MSELRASQPASLDALRGLHIRSSLDLSDTAIWAGLLLGVALALVGGFVMRRAVWRRSRKREAMAALERTRDLAPDERLVAQSKLLHRLSRSYGDRELKAPLGENRALPGEAWLMRLDRLLATTFFTRGAGRCFGEELYAARPASDPRVTDELAALLRRLRR